MGSIYIMALNRNIFIFQNVQNENIEIKYLFEKYILHECSQESVWSDFEQSLGNIDEDEFIEHCKKYFESVADKANWYEAGAREAGLLLARMTTDTQSYFRKFAPKMAAWIQKTEFWVGWPFFSQHFQ